MNIVQKINEFSTNDIILCEPIKNTIMDNSNFIRILISNKDIIINGIYLYLNIKAKNYYEKYPTYNGFDKHKYKKMLFLISNDDNQEVIDKLKNIEKQILLKTNNIHKNRTLKLGNNLDEGVIKVFRESESNNENTNKSFFKKIANNSVVNNSPVNETTFCNSKHLVENKLLESSKTLLLNKSEQEYKLLLKISGIWENSITSGITYKFLIV